MDSSSGHDAWPFVLSLNCGQLQGDGNLFACLTILNTYADLPISLYLVQTRDVPDRVSGRFGRN